VTHAALRRRLYFWARYVVAMDPAALLAAEEAMLRGESSQHPVRLPGAGGVKSNSSPTSAPRLHSLGIACCQNPGAVTHAGTRTNIELLRHGASGR
jgi:hypothetical protein